MFQIPTIAHLNRMYFELARIGANCVGAKASWPYDRILKNKEKLLALASDMSRFDPRLFEILVAFFLNHWSEINPVSLRSCYREMKWPETVAVICEFLKSAAKDGELIRFADYLSSGLKPSTTQFYFYNLYSPGGKLAQIAAEEGVYEFKKWGFLSAVRPVIDSKERKTAGLLDAVSRKNILKRLLAEKNVISLKDYLKAVHFTITRQQALLDLKNSGIAASTGKGRSAKWKLAA